MPHHSPASTPGTSTDDGKLTKAAIQDVLDASASTSSDDLLIQVIDARAVPRISYDPIRKAFYHDPQPPTLHADAKARPQQHVRPLTKARPFPGQGAALPPALTYPQAAAHPHGPVFQASPRRQCPQLHRGGYYTSSVSCAQSVIRYPQLTDIKALQGNVGDTKFVLGFLSQLEEGRYGLEDLSGSVLVDLTSTTRTVGLFTGAFLLCVLSLWCIP